MPTAEFPTPLYQWVHQGLYQKDQDKIPFWFSPSASFFLKGAIPGTCGGQKVRTLSGPGGFYVYWEIPDRGAFVFLFPSESFPWCGFLTAFRLDYADLQNLLKGQNPFAVPAFINPDKKR